MRLQTGSNSAKKDLESAEDSVSKGVATQAVVRDHIIQGKEAVLTVLEKAKNLINREEREALNILAREEVIISTEDLGKLVLV